MRLYLAHPFGTKDAMREWELGFEERTGIDLLNPFYDFSTETLAQKQMGRAARYKKINSMELVMRDVDQIKKSDGIIACVTDDLSYGTIQEMVYAKINNKPVYSVITNGHENHPWLDYHSTEKFTNFKDLEFYLNSKTYTENN